MATEERRKFKRFVVPVEVHWKKITGADGKTARHISHAKDVSVGGVCVILHPGIVVNDILQLEMILPSKNTIHSKGRVAWVDPKARVKGWTEAVYEGGIEFLDISDEDREEISHFLSAQKNLK